MKTAEYSKTAKGEGYLFHVTPAPKVIGGCAGIFFILLLASFGAMILASANYTLATIVFIGIVA